MDELTLTYLGTALGFASIVVTIIVAILVYKLQQKENKSTTNILDEIAKITKNQGKILASIGDQRKMHIQWFLHHVGGSLERLIKNYRELNTRIATYQTTRNELNLNKVMGGIHICKKSLENIRSLAERDIPIVAGYLSNPWIPGKFLDAISLLNIEIFDDKEGFRDIKDDDTFSVVREAIDQRIEDMEKYLKILKQEEKNS